MQHIADQRNKSNQVGHLLDLSAVHLYSLTQPCSDSFFTSKTSLVSLFTIHEFILILIQTQSDMDSVLIPLRFYFKNKYNIH